MAAAPSSIVVILAFGTRGDVQPLAVLAAGLVQQPFSVVFVSHAEHRPFLQALWRSNASESSGSIIFIPSPSPAHAATALQGRGSSSSPEAVKATLRPQAHLQACINACHRHDGGDGPPRLLIANLFSLEAVHLSEALDVPLVMAHPYPAPTGAPAAFARRLRRIDPMGYKALRHAESGLLAWKDVEHWIWPAITDAWRPFRCMLGLAKENEEDDDGCGTPHHLIGRPAPPLLYLYSEMVLPRPDYYPARAHVCGYLWPDADDGLATSHHQQQQQQQQQPYVPPAALASFLVDDDDTDTPAPATIAIPRVAPVLITFGTMVSLGALGASLDAAARVLAGAFGIGGGAQSPRQPQAVRVLLDAAGHPAWAEALRRAFGASGVAAQGVFVLEEPVPHAWLLRKCSVVLHHGGSGTTAAALRAGVAQVTVPMMMDQFLWAERVAWLDLGPPPLSLAAIFPSEDEELLAGDAERGPSELLARALDHALQPTTRLRAAAFGRRLRAEPSGLERCLELIRMHLEEWPRLRAMAGSAATMVPPLPDGCELLTLSPPSAGADAEEEDDKEGDGGLTVAALAGSEAEVAFCCQEIFVPCGQGGYLKHGVTVQEGDVVVDVGANIGLFALFLDQVEMEEPEQLTVVAVEPAPRTFAALEYNLRRHCVRHTACQVAVGEASGRATLHFYPNMPGNSTVDAARAASPRTDLNALLRTHLEAGREAIEVEMTTLPLLFQSEGLARVDLLKVDVEGHEEAVLKGMDAAAWACVRQLVAEVHDRDGARERIEALLRGPGGFGRVVWERPEWAGEGFDNVMVFATR